jgi:hypothetical protein
MALSLLLGDMSPATFVEEFFLRLPLAMPERANPFVSLGSWEVLGQLAAQPETDLMIVRDGQRSECTRPDDVEGVRLLLTDGHSRRVAARRWVPVLSRAASVSPSP